jgi:hypothetical protein
MTIDEPSPDGKDVPHCSTVKGTAKGLPSQDVHDPVRRLA